MKTAMAVAAVAAAGLMLLHGGSAQARAQGAAKLSGVANLNQASPSQLDLLPGVGEKAAKKIVAYREKTPFKRVEELVRVKGFGKKKFEKLKPYLSVTGPTTLVSEKREADGQARSAPPSR